MSKLTGGKWGQESPPRTQAYVPSNVKSWCYMCGEIHEWERPCKKLLELDWVRKEHDERNT